MKILLIELCNYIDYPSGGHLSFARNMLKAFQDELSLVGIATTEDVPTGMWSERTIDGVSYDYFSVRRSEKKSRQPLVPARLRNFLAVWKYRKQILAHSYDYIFIQTPEVLLALPEQVRARCILRMPGVENPLRYSRYKFLRCFRSLYERCFFKAIKTVYQILATANDKEIDDFVKRSRGAVDKKQLVQYPTRYDGEIYCVRDQTTVRRNLGIAEDAIVVSSVGRLGWFKGWKLMIDAFLIFRENHPNAVFFYIGDGEDQAKIEAYISQKDGGDAVKLLGRQLPVSIAAYLNASDLFIMGSFKEGWATTLVEACACAVPCVVTDFSSSEMIVDGENGYVVSSRDEQLFASRMESALNLSREHVRVFDERYSELSVQNMKRSFEAIIGRRKK